MLSRRLRLPHPGNRQCCHRWNTYARLSTDGRTKKPSSSSSSSPAPSVPLYEKLFAGKPAAEAASLRDRRQRSNHDRPSRGAQEDLRPSGPPSSRDRGGEGLVLKVDDELRVLSELAVPTREGSSSNPDTVPAVLVLSGLPRSLVPSDFFRLAPQGQHLAGWASGLTKVLQSLSALTREPRGQYFLFFDSRSAAHAYERNLLVMKGALDEKLKRHSSSQSSQLHLDTRTGKWATTLVEEVLGFAVGKPDLPSFTLTATTAPIRSACMTADELLNLIRKNTGRAGSAEHPAEPKPRPLAESSILPHGVAQHLRAQPEEHPTHSVLLHLRGSKVAVKDMIRAIRFDGQKRNLPWRLVEERPDVKGWPRPVQALRAGSGKIRWGEYAERGPEAAETVYGYTRFVVSFADMAEAWRFARHWHGMEVLDHRTQRVMSLSATVLW